MMESRDLLVRLLDLILIIIILYFILPVVGLEIRPKVDNNKTFTPSITEDTLGRNHFDKVDSIEVLSDTLNSIDSVKVIYYHKKQK